MMLVGVLAFALPGQAKPPPIILGQSTALSGPAKDLGREMQAGLRAAFAFTNDNGGVKGREVHLLSLDDGYEPDQAVRNTLELINDEQAFLLIGEVGTPTSKAVIPIIEEYKIPFFAPFTGAELLRTPFRRYVINIRASYYQEMEEIASYLVDQRGLEKIACFYQNDSYGFAGLQGIEKALRKRGMQLVSKGSYERNTLAVMGALHDIRKANPEAIVMVGAYPACAEFIKLSKTKLRQNLVFASISFVGTESLKDALGAYGENVFVSQVVPDPLNPSIPLVNEYRKSMQKYQYDAPISFVSLEGYIAGKLFASIATSVKGELTREMFITTMEQHGTFDLGGIVLTFGPRDHQGLDTIHLTRIYPQIAPLSATLPTSATHPLFPDLVSR
ncbi:MAG: leucine/isoleucine/valine-binding protein [Desulfobulbaceae bacterium]|nr:MAG: leucine/isoleucine/valine-binding protein [Desulfobulbaceae bacterium]